MSGEHGGPCGEQKWPDAGGPGRAARSESGPESTVASDRERARAESRGDGDAAASEGAQVTHPVGCSHLHHDLRGCPAEVPAVAAHHHGASLAIAQVDGRQHALDEVGQVVTLALEKTGGPPQPAAAGWPLVLVGRRGHSQHRDGAPLHGASWPVLPWLPGAGGNLQPVGAPPPAWRRAELRLTPRPPVQRARALRPPAAQTGGSSLSERPSLPQQSLLCTFQQSFLPPSFSPAGSP